jgi:hypothetical protein
MRWNRSLALHPFGARFRGLLRSKSRRLFGCGQRRRRSFGRVLEPLERDALLATMKWNAGVSGDYVAVKWSNSANPPGHDVTTSGDQAQIAMTGAITTHSSLASDEGTSHEAEANNRPDLCQSRNRVCLRSIP